MASPVFISLGRCRAIDLSVILIGCYLMLSPVWAPPFTQEIYDRARILQLGLLCLLVALTLAPGVAAAATRAWMALGSAVRVSVTVFLGIGAVSAALSEAPHVGILQVGLMAMLIALTLFTITSLQISKQSSERILAFCISAGAALFVLEFWLNYAILNLEGAQFLWSSPFFEFANVRFFGQYQAYALLLITLPLLVFRLGLRWRILLYFVAANLWSYQWILNSRALWAGFAAAVCLTSLLPTKARMRWLGEQGLLVLIGGIVSLWFHVPGSNHISSAFSIVERGNQSVNERIVLAKSALGMVKESPLLGVGPGQFGMNYVTTRAAHPHNSILQLLAEYGVLAGAAGLACLGALLMFATRRLWQKPRNDADLVPVALIAALVMGLCDSVFSGNLTMPHSQVFCFLLAGWIFGHFHAESGELNPVISRNMRTAVVCVVIVAGMATALLTVEYLQLLGQTHHLIADRIPNFWQYGRFNAW